MAVDQDQRLTEEKATQTVPANLNASAESTQHLLDWVSKEEDDFVPRGDTQVMNRFLLAMLWSSIAVAVVVAAFVLLANGQWIGRYLPK